MGTISNVLNSPNWSIQNNNQVSNTQGQTKIHHHHHKNTSQDSVQISDEAKQESDNKPKGPLDSLVANGTITQDQENSIRSAFISARQANKAGTYGSNPTNPLSSLVANNTITQAQADSITTAFKSRVQPNGDNNQLVGTQGQPMVHHHHHKGQQVQAATDPSQAILQSTDSSDSMVNSVLEAAESQNSLTQNQENAE